MMNDGEAVAELSLLPMPPKFKKFLNFGTKKIKSITSFFTYICKGKKPICLMYFFLSLKWAVSSHAALFL